MRLLTASALLVLACACGKPSARDAGFLPWPPLPDGSVSMPDASAAGCSTARDLTPCSAPDASTAICLGSACVPVAACDGGCTGAGPRFRIPDTNLRVCYGPSPNMMDGTIPCPGTPGGATCGTTDYCGEDAQYGHDTRADAGARFTSSTPMNELVVTDAITGLTWQGCSAGQAGAQCTGAATLSNWFDAVSWCETSTWGGFTDWKLPDSYELQTITDYGTTSPAIDTAVFLNAPSRFRQEYEQWWIECAWSSSSYARNPDVAWVLMTNNGDSSEGSGTTYHLNDKAAATWPGCYTRCVRDTAAPPAMQRFVRVEPVAGQPVVADTVTRLVWQGCSHGQTGAGCDGAASLIDWKSSLAYCEGLSWGGRDDWRLPNIKELRSLADLDRESPAIDVAAFPRTPFYGVGMTDQNAGQYWSSTARSYNDFALYADFGTGFTHFYKQPEGRHVRCVRDP